MVSDVRPSIVHAALLALGAKAGHPGPLPAGVRAAHRHGHRNRGPLEGQGRQASDRQGPGVDPQHQDQEGAGRRLGLCGQRLLDRRDHGQAGLPGRRRRFHFGPEPAHGHARPADPERRGLGRAVVRGLRRAHPAPRHAGDGDPQAEGGEEDGEEGREDDGVGFKA